MTLPFHASRLHRADTRPRADADQDRLARSFIARVMDRLGLKEASVPEILAAIDAKRATSPTPKPANVPPTSTADDALYALAFETPRPESTLAPREHALYQNAWG